MEKYKRVGTGTGEKGNAARERAVQRPRARAARQARAAKRLNVPRR